MIKKQLLIVLMLSFIGTSSIFGQSDSFNIPHDSILAKIKSNLPDGWEMYFDKKSLIVTKEIQMVGVIINRPTVDTNSQANNNQTNAAPVLPDTMVINDITFSFNNISEMFVWKTRKKASRSNNKINRQIDNLPKKMGIKNKDGKGKNSMFDFPSDEVYNEYQKRKKELKSGLVKVPRYHSQRYCFQSIPTKHLYNNYIWSPLDIESEIEEVESLFRNNLLK